MRPGDWRGRRVLLTGHTGFKGSWLALWLNRLGALVTGLALEPPTTPSLFVEARVHEVLRSVEGDVRDARLLRETLNDDRPEVIIHMAAQSLVRASYDDPLETYSTNVMGTLQILEAARSVDSVRAIVVVTTDKVYDNREWRWGYRENEPLGGHDPYSSSKACAELVTSSYRRCFFAERDVGVATARAGNVIAGGDWAKDRVVPDAMRAFAAGEPVHIRNPDSVRPWQHVLEPLSGYLLLAERLLEEPERFAGAYNFGPTADDSRPVSEVVDRLAREWGGGAHRVSPDQPSGPHEARQLRLDSTKARDELAWRPQLGLDDALSRVARWYKAHGAGEDARALTLRDVDEIMEAADG